VIDRQTDVIRLGLEIGGSSNTQSFGGLSGFSFLPTNKIIINLNCVTLHCCQTLDGWNKHNTVH
jgi:hypothetical protein